MAVDGKISKTPITPFIIEERTCLAIF